MTSEERSVDWDDRSIGTLRSYDPHHRLRWVRGNGPYLWDSTGRRYLDCVSGYSANVLGHCHPELVEAISEQAKRLAFVTGGECDVRCLLERRLSQIHAPEGRSKVWLNTTGARAIETAWRIALATRPGKLVTFDLGYHGRSIATAYISDTDRTPCFGESCVSIPISFPRRTVFASLDESCELSLEAAGRLFETRGDEISAVLIEPAIGSRGYYFAPDEFFQRLVRLAKSAGCLVISDEVQMGLGRLGGMVASRCQGWEADLVVFGKALGGGMMPISAVVGRQEVMDRLTPGIDSETFAGMPLACRMGIEVIRILDGSSIVEESAEAHKKLRRRLSEFLPQVSVDGVGSATVIDVASSLRFDDPRSDDDKGRAQARRMTELLQDRGILVHLTGPNRDRIAVIPPLLVPEEMICDVGDEVRRVWREISR